MRIPQGELPPDDRIRGLVRELVQECRRRGWEHMITVVGDEKRSFSLFHPGLTECQQELLREEIMPVLVRFAANFASMRGKIM
jgi:hypothetical protein